MVVETSFTAQQHMEHLEFVLQLYGKTMHEVIKEFPGLESYCGTRSDIVHSPDFEAAIIKIINDSENELSDNEKEADRH